MLPRLLPASFDVVALALTCLFCVWLAAVGCTRRRAPGAGIFAWLMLAVAVWTGLSAVHCRLVCEPGDNVPTVMADATQVRQTLLNLIVNATEAIEDSEVADGVVTVRTGVDRLPRTDLAPLQPTHSVTPGRYAWIEVADNGPGMPADTQARMFEPFFTTKATGRGLGLASVQGIVRQHRGALAVESREAGGTTIRVWWPVAPETP